MGFIYSSPPSQVALQDSKTSPRPASARVSWCLESSSMKTPFPGRISVLSSFVSLFIFYILSYLLSKTMGCFSGCLMTSASDQELFCEVCSMFNCSFDGICRRESGLPVLFLHHLGAWHLKICLPRYFRAPKDTITMCKEVGIAPDLE